MDARVKELCYDFLVLTDFIATHHHHHRSPSSKWRNEISLNRLDKKLDCLHFHKNNEKDKRGDKLPSIVK